LHNLNNEVITGKKPTFTSLTSYTTAVIPAPVLARGKIRLESTVYGLCVGVIMQDPMKVMDVD